MIADLLTMLDNVLEYFIENAPAALAKAVYSAVRERAIGLGGMGFHSYLQRLGVAYESDEALEIGEDIVREIRGQGLAISRILAAERGVPPDMAGTGLRWSHMFAWAPNASSSILVGTSPASEPWKANAFTQRTRAGSVLVKNKYLEAILERIGKNTPEVWSSIITNGGSVEHLDFLDDQTKAVFRTSFEIHQFWVVDHAAVRQPHICQGQSVNIFFKAGAQRKYVRETHERAYDKSLKGLYYLRTESKQRAENVNKEVTTEKLVDDKKTIVYGKSNCPFCEQAKRILDSKGIAYEYVDITTTGKTAAEITGRPGVRTVPQIYLEGEYIGGFQELYKKLTEPDKTISDDECKACEG
jgi:ribonucleoside-diphosphate reductase alpha chain